MRAPLWLMALLVLVVVGVGIYGYFTTPLPFGLNSVVRTPGGSNGLSVPLGNSAQQPVGARTTVGQTLVLGATSVVVQSAVRNQDVAATSRGPVGSFTVVQIDVQNGGTDPLLPKIENFHLLDDTGRRYAVDLEATRAVNTAARHRLLFEATVPPAGRVTTLLAFETPATIGALTLQVALGYGELELPR